MASCFCVFQVLRKAYTQGRRAQTQNILLRKLLDPIQPGLQTSSHHTFRDWFNSVGLIVVRSPFCANHMDMSCGGLCNLLVVLRPCPSSSMSTSLNSKGLRPCSWNGSDLLLESKTGPETAFSSFFRIPVVFAIG